MNRYRTLRTMIVVAFATMAGLIVAVAATPRGEPKSINSPVVATTVAASTVAFPLDEPDKRKPKGGSKRGPSDEILAMIARDHVQRLTTWRGTEISPSPDAADTEWELQQEIAIAFREQDPKPRQRLKSFESMLSDKLVAVVGWRGWIERLTPTPDGCAVEVRIMPQIESTGGGVAITDSYCVETWLYTGDELRYEKTAPLPRNVKPLRIF